MNKQKGGISDIELIKYFDQCIDEELSKPVSDQDMELIDKCNAVIEKLQPDIYKPDPAMKARQLKMLLNKCKYDPKNSIRVARGFKKNKIAVAVVAAAISVTSLTVAACAVSNKTPIQLIQDFGNKIFGIAPGGSVDIGNMTLIRGSGESVKYGSIEEAVKAEGLDIYYPTWLPDGVRIESVYVNETADGCEVLFMFDSDSVSMTIECKISQDDGFKYVGYMEYDFGGISVFVLNFDNVNFAKFEIDGKTYSINAKNIDEIEKMVENLMRG